jgi:hypothetical protein
MASVDDLMELADEAIHSYAAWLAEFTMGDLQSLNVMRLHDESEAARRKLHAALTAAHGVMGTAGGQTNG